MAYTKASADALTKSVSEMEDSYFLKEELSEIVEFLKDTSKFDALGARIPKGVLLVGPPGTGKTLLARAVAGEAGVPFFSISGSDFVEMFVGVGASRVRDLFGEAKKNAPAIIFIDEIDAVGRHRGAGLGGGHDEREQTLNQLLVEMDGFGNNTGIIVMAATNRADILDPALLRPGRFDRQIVVGAPDVEGREAILKIHTRNKPLGPDVDLNVIAKSTAGFTGAELENLTNEAALLAARRKKKAITMKEIEEATIKVVAGPEKRSRKVNEKDKRLTSYHEAGHAVVTYFCETQDPVHEISIIPRGYAGGYTMSLPVEDRNYVTKRYMEEELCTLLGGRVAEAIVLGDISTGASNDLERATRIARNMVTRYGFSEKLGPVVYGSDENEVFLGRDYGQGKHYSDDIASDIDSEIRRLVDEKLIYGIGVSLVNPTDEFISLVKQYPNAVIHVINGVLRPSDIEVLSDNNLKMLILGYKQLRRGNEWYNEDHENIVVKQMWLKDNLAEIINHFKVVSFDNLAIEQLEVQRLMSKEEWDEFYMGDDGTMTYYIDMVERKFARSSTADFEKRYDLLDSVDEMFQKIVSEQ